MSSESYEFDDDRPTKRWKMPLSWPAVLIGAWILYEVTTQPAIAIVTVCLKFGWNDFRTALWIRRRDLDRHRARACFWLYLASGLWKTAVAAVAPLIMLPVLFQLQAGAQQQPRPPADPPAQFMAVVLTLFFGFVFSALTTIIASWIAWRHGIRIWLNSAIRQDSLDDVWPPLHVLSSAVNHFSRPLTAALFTAGIPVLIGLIVWLGANREVNGGPQPAQRAVNSSATMVLSIILGSLIGLPFLILLTRGMAPKDRSRANAI